MPPAGGGRTGPRRGRLDVAIGGRARRGAHRYSGRRSSAARQDGPARAEAAPPSRSRRTDDTGAGTGAGALEVAASDAGRGGGQPLPRGLVLPQRGRHALAERRHPAFAVHIYEHDIDEVEVRWRRDPAAYKQAIGSAGGHLGARRGGTAATRHRRRSQGSTAGGAAAQAHQAEGGQGIEGDPTRRGNVSGCARSTASAIISAGPAAFGGGAAEHPAR